MIDILPKQKAPGQNGFTDKFLSEDKSRGNTFYFFYETLFSNPIIIMLVQKSKLKTNISHGYRSKNPQKNIIKLNTKRYQNFDTPHPREIYPQYARLVQQGKGVGRVGEDAQREGK